MNDILIITSRNVVTSGGEFSLIKNRARALEKYWGLSTDVIALCNTNLGVKEGEEAFGSGVYVRRNFMNPVALLSGYETLIKEAEKALALKPYKAVLLSGVGLLRYVDRIKSAASSRALVCADVHGYFGDGKLLAKDEAFVMGMFHTLAAMVEEHEQKTYLKKFDRIFTVSSAYREFLCREAGCRFEQFYIVPCATGDIPSFRKDEEANYRRCYREKYGIAQDELLMVYSGGASSWQCLPETVQLYERIKNVIPAKLLILSGDKTGVLAAIGNATEVLVDSYQPTELPKVFCAADCFVMLRDDVLTNHFAFPNKFLEYAAAHRPVIATPFVYDIASQIAQEGVGILYDGDVDGLIRELKSFSCGNAQYDTVVNKSAFKVTLVPFVSDIARIGDQK